MDRRDPFDELLDRASGDDAAAARTRERWLRQQAAEEASLSGMLLDLAERGAGVRITTLAGRAHIGVVVAVGHDVAVVRTTTGPTVHVALDAVGSVRPLPGGLAFAAHGDDRRPADDLTLAVCLADAAAERPRVAVGTTGGGELVTGDLVAVGRDLVTVALDGDPASRCYLPLRSLAEVTFLTSG